MLTEANGLLYMRARYYSPDMMRFINEDIVTGDISNSNSLNRYSYVEGNPVSMVDPFGLEPEKSGWQKIGDWFNNVLTTCDNFIGSHSTEINIGLWIGAGALAIFGGPAGVAAAICVLGSQVVGEIVGGVDGAIDYYGENGTLEGSKDYIIYNATKGEAYGGLAGLAGGCLYEACAVANVVKASAQSGVALSTYLSNPYNNEVPDSVVLRQNMINAGEVVPEFKNAAHHIVAGAAQKAEEARAILHKFGIAINDAVNGVFLPTERGVSEATYHPSVHTNVYYDAVNILLGEATSKQDVIDILGYIKESLINGEFLH